MPDYGRRTRLPARSLARYPLYSAVGPRAGWRSRAAYSVHHARLAGDRGGLWTELRTGIRIEPSKYPRGPTAAGSRSFPWYENNIERCTSRQAGFTQNHSSLSSLQRSCAAKSTHTYVLLRYTCAFLLLFRL